MVWLPFWPTDASATGGAVDVITLTELGLISLVLISVYTMMLVFIVKYRRGSKADRTLAKKSWRIEIGWTSATLLAFIGLFAWGAVEYVYLYKPPRTDLQLYVVGKQWMWKIEYPGGQREIDSIHVPVNKSVRVVLASEDVVHSFFVPNFRAKHDAVPGQYEVFWFEPTRIGDYEFECSEFCGTGHAQMIGTIHVLSQTDYTRWLTEQPVSGTLAEQGAALFRRYGCSGCHTPSSTVHAPDLHGVYGTYVHLADGRTMLADERYIRDCILLPATERVAGYPPVMPSFSGQIPEEDLIKLVAYIQSLGQAKESP